MNKIIKNIFSIIIVLLGILVNKSINGQTYYPIDYHPYDTTYYKLIQRDCDGRLTKYSSDIIVCFREPKMAINEPNAYYDNGIVLTAGDYLTDAYIYTMSGAQRYTIRLKPGWTKRVNYYGQYIVELIWVVDGDIQRKSVKIFSFE